MLMELLSKGRNGCHAELHRDEHACDGCRSKKLEKSSGNGCTFSLMSAEILSHGGNW